MIRFLVTWAVLPLFHIVAFGEQRIESSPITFGSESQGIKGVLRQDGSLEELQVRYADGFQKVEFRRDDWRGPGFGKSIVLVPVAAKALTFGVEKDGIQYQLVYAVTNRQLQITATVSNHRSEMFAPERLPLVLGVDSFMNRFPRWNDLFFPTFLRCEPAHFWGYLMTPHGRILGVDSPDPVGSYTIEYLRQLYAHYIFTVSFDLLQKPPVPGHHPAYKPMAPSEQRSWTFYLLPIETLEDVKPELAASAAAPMLDIYSYSLESGRSAEMRIFSPAPVQVTVVTPAGLRVPCHVDYKGSNVYTTGFNDTGEYGEYRVELESQTGKSAIGQFFVRPPWSWYLQQSRLEALRLTPRADTNSMDGYSCESYYSLLGFYLAAKHFPDPAIDIKGDRLLEKILARLFKEKDGMRFSGNVERVQNSGFMISVLVDRYEATGDLKSLEMANQFAEFLLSRQHKDGYYGGFGFADYNAVIYPTKTLAELMAAEKPLTADSALWRERYERQSQSIKRAVDYMVAQGLDIKTEGGGTFEDGAVSCKALQIALFALNQSDVAMRNVYTDAAEQLLTAHACLSRLLDIDSRSIGGTARWWEVWSDEHRAAQMMTSPHGWTGWTLYANYYVYLLTGKEKYLRDLMNTLGAGTRLLDWPSGRLRQSFVIDPHITNIVHVPDSKDLQWGRAVETITSEDYIGTIGDWWGRSTPGDTYLDRVEWGWEGDGIPFEIFKAMEEIVVTQAFVVERSDGSIVGYNCAVTTAGSTVTVTPSESIVRRVHVNLRTSHQVRVNFAGEPKTASCTPGMQWIVARNSKQ